MLYIIMGSLLFDTIRIIVKTIMVLILTPLLLLMWLSEEDGSDKAGECILGCFIAVGLAAVFVANLHCGWFTQPWPPLNGDSGVFCMYAIPCLLVVLAVQAGIAAYRELHY